MHRYLLNISYLGTPFRGAQRQVSVKEGRINDPTTIQGQIEMGLKRLWPLNEPAAVVSSRTDAGVHALHSTMHVDLQRQGQSPYNPRDITGCLNKFFTKNEVPIRILKTYLVPNEFHCRHNAISRTYMFRLGVVSGDQICESLLTRHVPIQEFNRCMFICTNSFDISKANEAAKLFEGLHDFRSFMHKSTLAPEKMTRRRILQCEIMESIPLWSDLYCWPYCVVSNRSDYKIYNIIIKGDGFLQRQVRRTVAALIAVAKGIVTPRDIKFMLEIPSHLSWNSRIITAAAQGLYLCEVAYSRNDLETFEEQLEN